MVKVDSQPLVLRAHHINSLKELNGKNPQEVSDILREQGYINDFKKEIIPAYDKLRSAFENPDQRVLLIAFSHDLLCDACELKIDVTCFENRYDRIQKARSLIGFFADLVEHSDDLAIANNYGLEIGKEYTVREIREKAGF